MPRTKGRKSRWLTRSDIPIFRRGRRVCFGSFSHLAYRAAAAATLKGSNGRRGHRTRIILGLRSRNRMRDRTRKRSLPLSSLYPFLSQSREVALWSLLKWSATPRLRLYNRFPKLRPLQPWSGRVWRTDRNCRLLCLKHRKTCFESTSLTRPPISVETGNRDISPKVLLSNRPYEILLNIRFLRLYVSAFSICEGR